MNDYRNPKNWKNNPNYIGTLIIILAAIGALAIGSDYSTFRNNWILALAVLISGVLVGGVFFAIGAVITRQHEILYILQTSFPDIEKNIFENETDRKTWDPQSKPIQETNEASE